MLSKAGKTHQNASRWPHKKCLTNENPRSMSCYPDLIFSFLDGSMAWHSLQADMNNLKNLHPIPGFALLFSTATFFCLNWSSCTAAPALLRREGSRLRTGAGVMNCHLWEFPYGWAKTGLFARYPSLVIAVFATTLACIVVHALILSELSLELVLALLQLLLLLLVLLLLDDTNESLLLMLLVLLFARAISVRGLADWQGNTCGKSLPLQNKWSAGELLLEGKSGVTQPNSNSESWSWLWKEKMSPELLCCRRLSIGSSDTLCTKCVSIYIQTSSLWYDRCNKVGRLLGSVTRGTIWTVWWMVLISLVVLIMYVFLPTLTFDSNTWCCNNLCKWGIFQSACVII